MPVISVRAGLLGGLRIEPDNLGGVSELMTQCWGKETQSMTEYEQSKFIELRSSSMSTFSGKNTNGLSMTTLTPHFSDMFDMYLENLCNPKFNERIMEREKNFLVQTLRQQQDLSLIHI